MHVCLLKFCFFGALLYSQLLSTVALKTPRALDVIQEKEEFVKRLADEASSLFRRRSKEATNCECSLHACNGIVSEKHCKALFRKSSTTLCSEGCKRMDLAGPTYVRTPTSVQIQDLSSEMKESICLYKNLEPILREQLSNPNTSTEVIAKDGHTRLYPALDMEQNRRKIDPKNGNCEEYEPRLTDTYIGALTGPKDIVFILDASKSWNRLLPTKNTSWWDIIIDHMPSLLETMSSFDLVGVVKMADHQSTTPLGNRTRLVSGTRALMRSFVQEIKTIEPNGQANTGAAFDRAFRLLIQTSGRRKKRAQYLGGQKVIIYFTRHSNSGKGRQSTHRLLNQIAKYQDELYKESGKKAAIFSYSFGAVGDNAFPKQVACANDGAWFPVQTYKKNLLRVLTAYNTFLGLTQLSENPIWTNPRKNKNGSGWLTTVAKGFYFSPTSASSGKDSVFLGAVIHDVSISEITSTGALLSNIRKILTRRSRRHQYKQPNPCLLQVYRNVYANASICPDDGFLAPSYQKQRKGKTKSKTLSQDPPCYAHRGKFYKLFHDAEDWMTGSKNCQRDGGTLLMINSTEQRAFVSGIVASDGTWIAARQKRRNKQFAWEGMGDVPTKLTLSNIHVPFQYKKQEKALCVQLDNRGVDENFIARPCRRKASYLCVYDQKKSCRKLMRVPKRGYFKTPSLDTCIQEEEALANAKPISKASNIPSSSVLCSSPNNARALEDVCCARCSNEKVKGKNSGRRLMG